MERISDVLLDGTDITSLSDGEFDVAFLKSYPHREHLLECCQAALRELGEQPYFGRSSCARVLALTMELLRQKYEQAVPRGWYPAIKRLRDTRY